MKSQNVGTERQPHCLRGRVKDSFRLYSKCQRQPQSKISYMLDIFRIGNLSFCCAASWRSKLKSHCAPSLEIELLWTCAFLKWIQKFKAHFRCLMQTIMVSLTLQSLWRWEYQNNFFVKVEIPKTKICKGPGDVHNEECGEREKTSIPFRHLRHRRRWTYLQQRAVQGGRMSTALPSRIVNIFVELTKSTLSH